MLDCCAGSSNMNWKISHFTESGSIFTRTTLTVYVFRGVKTFRLEYKLLLVVSVISTTRLNTQ